MYRSCHRAFAQSRSVCVGCTNVSDTGNVLPSRWPITLKLVSRMWAFVSLDNGIQVASKILYFDDEEDSVMIRRPAAAVPG